MLPAASKILNNLAEVFEQVSLRTAGSGSVDAETPQTELAIVPARLLRTKWGWRSSANFESRLGCSALATRHVCKASTSWAKGATGYVSNTNWWTLYDNSNSRAMGWATDGIFSTGTDVELTEAWSINAAYQHVWGLSGTFGGKWKTSVYGGYDAVEDLNARRSNPYLKE